MIASFINSDELTNNNCEQTNCCEDPYTSNLNIEAEIPIMLSDIQEVSEKTSSSSVHAETKIIATKTSHHINSGINKSYRVYLILLANECWVNVGCVNSTSK